MWIRRYKPGDASACAVLFYRAVHEGASGAYTAEQRDAWAKQVPDTEYWHKRLSNDACFVAERDGVIAGFMTLEPDGHVGLAYVAPEEMGRGTAAALYAALLNEATVKRLKSLTTEASHLAKPFFEKFGWQVVTPQQVERHGVLIPNYKMRCDL
ncbi:MAG: GNAT family N-acetyltransferase [Pseudomonadota bacterium]